MGTSYQGHGRIINLIDSTQVLEYEIPHFQSSITPTPFHLAHLLSLSNLLARKIRGTQPLVDYNKSHVVTTIEYLEIMQQKATKKKLQNIKKRPKERNERNERNEMTSKKLSY
jgi:hypothetical protein